MRDEAWDVAAAGMAAAALSGLPSTAVTLARGEDLLEAGRAAGSILLPREERTAILLAAALPVHLALSLGWAAVLARALPRGHEVPAGALAGALAGLGIAALDLGVLARLAFPRVRALPQGRQWADHVAYGVTAGAVLARRRARRRASAPREAAGARSRAPSGTRDDPLG